MNDSRNEPRHLTLHTADLPTKKSTLVVKVEDLAAEKYLLPVDAKQGVIWRQIHYYVVPADSDD